MSDLASHSPDVTTNQVGTAASAPACPKPDVNGLHSYNHKGGGTTAMTKNSKKQKAERVQRETKIKSDVPSAIKYPDFAARRKKIFGDRALNAVDDFLKYRHREWELEMEADLKARQDARIDQTRKP